VCMPTGQTDRRTDAGCYIALSAMDAASAINAKCSGQVHIRVSMNKSTFFSRSLKEHGYGNRLWRKSTKNGISHLHAFCALGFHNGCEDRNKDAPVNTADDPSTSDKNLVNCRPVTPEFCSRACAGRAARWALPRI